MVPFFLSSKRHGEDLLAFLRQAFCQLSEPVIHLAVQCITIQIQDRDMVPAGCYLRCEM